MWWLEDAVQLGHTGEILVSLRRAPGDTHETVRVLEKHYIFEILEFITDTDDRGVTTEWAVLYGAKVRVPEVA